MLHFQQFSVFWCKERRITFKCQVSVHSDITRSVIWFVHDITCIWCQLVRGQVCRQLCTSETSNSVRPSCASQREWRKGLCMPTKSLLDAMSLQVKIQKFSLEFMENVTVEERWKLHPPVLSVDDEMWTKDVMWTSVGFTTALLLSLERLGLVNLQGKWSVQFLLVTSVFPPTLDQVQYHRIFLLYSYLHASKVLLS